MAVKILLLAAGSSSRLGFSKQLFRLGNKTLIRRMTEIALETGNQVWVVVGAHAEKIIPEISDMPITLLHNPDWAEGMASSLRLGIEKLEDDTTAGIMVMLCDQVFVEATLLTKLIQTFEYEKPLAVCSEYAGQKGVPAVFGKDLFRELLQLQGDRGAKSIIARYESQILSLPFPQGNTDLDTQADLDNLTHLFL